MLRKIRLGLTLLILPYLLPAQVLVNSGADITIKSGTAIKINGKLIHHTNSHILNNGIISLNGDYENFSIDPVVYLPGTSGLLKFTGTNTHTIDGTGPLVVPNLSIETDVVFNNLVIIENHLDFNNGNVFLTYPILDIETGATLSGYGPNSYIQTDGNEIIYFPVKMSETILPIGTTSTYTPISIASNDGEGEVTVSLNSDVLENGNSGVTIPEIEQTIKHTWELNFWGFPSTPDLDIKFQWPGNVEGNIFNPLTAALSYFYESAWDFFPVQGATGNDPYQLNQPGISESGFFTIWSKQPELITLDLKVYLEGAYNPAYNQMNNVLAELNYLPLNQPYNPSIPYYNENDPVWLYGGVESVGTIPPNVVDWIIIQVRDAETPANASSSTIIGQQAAFILNDGSIVDLDGSSLPQIFSVTSRNLYAVVFHRNHLGVISANGLTESGGIHSYDFSSGAAQALGGANGHKQLEAGIWGMVAGDGNGNGLIQNTDETAVWKTDLGQSGYKGGDFNMNGLVQNTDETNYWRVNLGAGGQTPVKSNQTGYQSQVPD